MKSKLIFGNGKVPGVIRDDDTTVLSRLECDITDIHQIESSILKHNPKIMVNCAAKTNLEWCQENKHESFKVNTTGPINLINIAKKFNIKLVHISSGCLFDGNLTLSTEESKATPRVWYTWTKLWADQYIQNFGYDNYLILRPRQLISAKAHPSNMLTKFLMLDKFNGIEEKNSVTCIEDFSDMISHLLDKDEKGVFNCCNDGTLSPYSIAHAIKKTLAPNMEVSKITYEELLSRLPNKRVNTILSTEKLKSTGYKPRSAIDALMWCLENYSD